MKTRKNRIIDIDGMKYNERHLAQLIRRKMLTKSVKDKTKYIRNLKHKHKYEDVDYD